MTVEVDYPNGRKLFVIPQFLTPEECLGFIERSEQLGYTDAPINSSFGPLLRKDVRDNQRILLDDRGHLVGSSEGTARRGMVRLDGGRLE
jgi:hypothetical protein